MINHYVSLIILSDWRLVSRSQTLG